MDNINRINKIDSITEDFLNEFGELTEEKINLKPDNKSWSIAQNIHHLIVINESYYPVIKAVREDKNKIPFIGHFGFIVNMTGNMILNAVKPDRKKKVKTFPIWEPASDNFSKDILKKFSLHQEELKQLINKSSDLISKGTVISSPANKNIVYKLDTAFDIIITHEQRHFEQAKEVKKIIEKAKKI